MSHRDVPASLHSAHPSRCGRCDHVIRSMPNTPAMVGKSMTVWTCTEATSEHHRKMMSALVQGALGLKLLETEAAGD